MAERISFGDTLILKGEKILIDNDTNDGIIKSKNGIVRIDGNLTVSGTTTTVNSETVTIADNIIVLNSNETGSPFEDGGIEIERGTSSNKSLTWNETDDKWTVGSESFVAGTFEGAVTGDVTGTVSSLANHDTDSLSEGSRLYYTDIRSRGAISVSGDLSYDSATGIISSPGLMPLTLIKTLTTNYTPVTADHGYYIRIDSTSNVGITLVSDSTENIPIGTTMIIGNLNTGVVSISGGAGAIVISPTGYAISIQYGKVTVMKTAANTWEINGDLI